VKESPVIYDEAAEARHRALREQFLLRPDVTFLNHGSYGACPRPVFEKYQAWQRELEAQPVEFLGRRRATLLADARAALATYLGHITSATAAILPLAPLIARAKERGIWTVIDGAHAPGQIDLDLHALGVDFYGGNCHKWLSAPKGAGFLYARRDVQDLLEPLV